jgi:hypothetical protein
MIVINGMPQVFKIEVEDTNTMKILNNISSQLNKENCVS